MRIEGTKWLMASLLYGAGLRLMECVSLMIKDVDFSYNHIVVRKGKGDKDRITMLPESLKGPLQLQIARVKVHDEDLKQGFGSVSLPDALEKKYPNANKEFACSIRVEKVCGVHWIIYDAFHVTVHLIYMTTL